MTFSKFAGNAALATALAFGLGAQAATLSWDSDTSTPGAQDGTGTWDIATANTNWWNGTTNVTWNNTTPDSAIIGTNSGAAGTITLATNIRTGGLTFNPAGTGNYTLAGNSFSLTNAGNLTVNSSATLNVPLVLSGAQTWTLGAGQTLTINSNVTGAGSSALTLQGPGTANLASVTGVNGITLFQGGGTWNLNGGNIGAPSQFWGGWCTNGQTMTVNYNAGNLAAAVCYLGRQDATANGTNYLNLQGGSISSSGGDLIGQVNGINILTVNGGSYTNTAANNYFALGNASSGSYGPMLSATLTINGPGRFVLLNNGASSALLMPRSGFANMPVYSTINLNGGALTTGRTINGNGQIATSIFNFNGGLLQSLNSQANWITRITHAYVKSGGAIIDDGGFTMTIPQGLEHDPSAPATDGGLVKLGAGTLTLASSTNNFTGGTVVSNGTLFANGTLGGARVAAGATLAGTASFSGAGVLQNGGTLAPGDNTGNGALSFGSLTFGSSSTDLTSNQCANVFLGAKITAGAVTVNGTNVINIFGAAPGLGAWPLINYTTLSGAGTFVLGILPGGSGGYLTNFGSALQYYVTNYAPETLVWTGTNTGNWSLSATSKDWNGTIYNLNPQAFQNYLSVTFNDSLPTAVGAVNISANVTPLNVTVSGANNYTFKGTGSIVGPAALTINGPGALTIANTNTYSGGTTINGGTLVITNGGGIPGNINDNSVVVFNGAGAQAFSGQISGAGMLLKSGAGALTLNTTNVYTGGTIVSNGTLVLPVNGGLNGEVGNIGGPLTVLSNAMVLSQAQDTFGTVLSPNYVTTLNLGGGTLMHSATANLSLWGTAISLTNGAMSATNSGGRLDLGNGAYVNTYAHSNASVISGTSLYLRQATSLFTVERGTGPLDLLITAPISQNVTASITKDGPGVMALAGNNSYSGGTMILNGVLQVGNGGGAGSLGTGTVDNNGILSFNRTNSYTVGNAITGSGSLQQNGAGTVILSAVNAYSGPTTVAAGTLEIDGQLSSSGLEVMTNATLAHGATGAGSYATLTLDAGSTNAFVAGAATDTVTTSSGFTVNGPAVIQLLNPLPATTGIYDLIYYSGGIGGSGFAALSLALPPGSRATATLQTNLAGTAVQLNLTDAGALEWNGNVAGNWDLSGGTEWQLFRGGSPTAFRNGDTVWFNDTNTTYVVNIATNVLPASVLVAAVGNYSFGGTGAIAGATSLIQNGPGTLTITNVNTYTGPTTVNGGVLRVASGGYLAGPINIAAGEVQLADGGTLSGTITDNALFEVTRSSVPLSFAAVISGSGTVLKDGTAVVTLTGANTYAGGTTNRSGTLEFSSAAALGSGPVTLSDANTGTNSVSLLGITVNTGVAGRYTYANPIVIASNSAAPVVFGCTNTAALVANSAITYVGNITLNRDVTILAQNAEAYIGNNNGTVTGTGNITCAGNARILLNAIGDGDFSGDVYVTNTAAVQFYGDRMGATRNLDLATGTGFMVQDNVQLGKLTGSGVVGENIGHTGTLTLGNGDVSWTFSGSFDSNPGLVGVGIDATTLGLAKVGAGVFTFNGFGNYHLATVVSNGTLALGPAGSINASQMIDVQSGAWFDVSAVTGYAVAPGQTLAGNGSIIGPVTVGNGALLSPGEQTLGVLTFNNALTLAAGSTTVFGVDKDAPTNSLAIVAGHLTYGGTLVVTNLGVTPLVLGDAFTLFQAGSYSGSFTNIAPATPGPGLVWDATSLAVNGTLKVAAPSRATITGIAAAGTNGFSLTFTGTNGNAWTVLASTNLALPLINWTTLGNGVFGSGASVYQDQEGTNFTQRFYKIQVP